MKSIVRTPDEIVSRLKEQIKFEKPIKREEGYEVIITLFGNEYRTDIIIDYEKNIDVYKIVETADKMFHQ